MKFRKVSFYNHPILGNVCFDFTDQNGNTVDTIIIAGENGCGKSLFLSILYNYQPNISSKELGYKLKLEVEFSKEEIATLRDNRGFESEIGKHISGNVFTFTHDTTSFTDYPRVEYFDKQGVLNNYSSHPFTYVPGVFKTVFSDVEINFTPNVINHISSKNLDVESTSSIRSSIALATEIKQLLIDIDNLDNAELSRWVDTHPGQVPTENVKHRRIKRFTNAFDTIFPNKRFVGTDNKDNHIIVKFEEFGKQMELDQLSSGEKQIVFRGGFLLRNLVSIKGAPILVDEPELSLHPQWQLKILGFLKNLFTDEQGLQTSQLIVATHSPFILHNDTRANDKILVMKKDSKGIITILDKPEYYNWSEATAVEEAFNVSPILRTNSTIVFLEGETDELYFRKACEVYNIDTQKLLFFWIGHYSGNKKNKAENTGDTALNSAAAFFKANPFIMKSSKIYLLYDCDTNKPESQDGNLFIGEMTKNPNAAKYQIGVENLLILPDGFEYSKYYKTTTKTNNYGATSTFGDLDKQLLAQYITSLPKDKLVDIMRNIKVEVEKILIRTQNG